MAKMRIMRSWEAAEWISPHRLYEMCGDETLGAFDLLYTTDGYLLNRSRCRVGTWKADVGFARWAIPQSLLLKPGKVNNVAYLDALLGKLSEYGEKRVVPKYDAACDEVWAKVGDGGKIYTTGNKGTYLEYEVNACESGSGYRVGVRDYWFDSTCSAVERLAEEHRVSELVNKYGDIAVRFERAFNNVTRFYALFNKIKEITRTAIQKHLPPSHGANRSGQELRRVRVGKSTYYMLGTSSSWEILAIERTPGDVKEIDLTLEDGHGVRTLRQVRAQQ